jgi:foldase protein PrsA
MGIIGKVRISHIMCHLETQAMYAQSQIEQGVAFEEVAKLCSQDNQSKDKGGDLGYIDRIGGEKAIEDAAFALEVGEITPRPIMSMFGWHVIKRTA